MVLRFQHHNEQYISYIVTMVENIRVLGKSHRYIGYTFTYAISAITTNFNPTAYAISAITTNIVILHPTQERCSQYDIR
jgi:hypothetical protein